MSKRLVLSLLISLVAGIDVAHASGHAVLADQGDNYQFDGQKWPNVTTQAGSTVTLPFAIDVGAGPSAPTFVTQGNGSVQFTNGDFIDIALSSQSYVPAFAISNDRGRIDPSLVDSTLAANFSADPDTAGLDSYRFLYNGVCPASNPGCTAPFAFEAVLVYLTPEAFVLQFNFGSFGSPIADGPLDGVTVGFSLGGNTRTIVDDGIVDGPEPDFCFNNGVASTFSTIAACTGTTVVTPPGTIPEPDVRSLFLLGGLLIAASAAFKSRRRTQRASI